MQDLSHLLPGSPFTALVPTAQESGNLVSSNEQAFSAPGSEPVTPMPAAGHLADPSLVPAGKPRAVITPEGDPSPDPWTMTAGRPWMQAGDDSPGSTAQGPWRQT